MAANSESPEGNFRGDHDGAEERIRKNPRMKMSGRNWRKAEGPEGYLGLSCFLASPGRIASAFSIPT